MRTVCNSWQIYEHDFLVFTKEYHQPKCEIQFVLICRLFICANLDYKFKHALNLCHRKVYLYSVT
jgi:hypothetical protein